MLRDVLTRQHSTQAKDDVSATKLEAKPSSFFGAIVHISYQILLPFGQPKIRSNTLAPTIQVQRQGH